MPRQITLDTVAPTGINILKGARNSLRVEANYQILAGTELVKVVSRDITQHIPSDTLTSLSTAYDNIFAAIEQVEIT